MPRLLLLPIPLLLVLLSCKKETIVTEQGEPGEKGSPGKTIPGTIKGKIDHFDQYGQAYQNTLNNSTITLVGKGLAATTNIDGEYEIKEVPPGIYDVSIVKPDCGKIVRQQISFPGNGTYYLNDTVRDKASFDFQICYVKDTIVGPPYSKPRELKKVILQVTPESLPRAAIVMISYDTLVDIFNIRHAEQVFLLDIPSSATRVDVTTSILTGYTRIYPNVVGTNGTGYKDIQSGKMIFPNVGKPYQILKLN